MGSDEQIEREVEAAGGGGGGTLLSEPVLIVNQKTKLIELTNEYKVFDQNGNQIGTVAEVGQSNVKKALRLVSSLDQFMTHRYEIRDASGSVLLQMERPRKVLKSSFIVQGPGGEEIGRVIQRNMFGKIRFGFEAGGQDVGSLNAENWRAWNFSIRDALDQEVARITKTWEGLAKTVFTTADNYVLEINAPLEDPLRSLVVAAALCVDTALKQDERGFN